MDRLWRVKDRIQSWTEARRRDALSDLRRVKDSKSAQASAYAREASQTAKQRAAAWAKGADEAVRESGKRHWDQTSEATSRYLKKTTSEASRLANKTSERGKAAVKGAYRATEEFGQQINPIELQRQVARRVRRLVLFGSLLVCGAAFAYGFGKESPKALVKYLESRRDGAKRET